MPGRTDHWVKDEFSLRCNACDVEFSLSVRRHHCRCCGEVFCSECTSKKIVLPHLGYSSTKPEKVCETCFTTQRLKQERRARSPNANDDKDEKSDPVVEGLKVLYRQGIKPLERMFKFDEFNSPMLSDADFDAKPLVLLIGQYSVGKTSFIRYLVGKDFPNARIAPEPTTDKFTIVAESRFNKDQICPGNSLAVQSDAPYRSLQKFGASFLNHLELSEVDLTDATRDVLRDITFVDTPGVLSGEKQRIGRAYDFDAVVSWFASRCDRIILLWDSNKLDISDEMQAAISALKGHDEKIRVVLNKADQVDAQALMRVHGALMWGLGKIISTPEVVRVYVGSFWDNPVVHKEFEALFQREEYDLIEDLKSLPRSSRVRKINEVVKRARAARTHALLIDHLRNKLPFFGREKALAEMLRNLPREYAIISREKGVPVGDFPSPESFSRVVRHHDLSSFPPLNSKMLSETADILASVIPRLLMNHNENVTNELETEAKSNPFALPSSVEQEISSGKEQGVEWEVTPEQFQDYLIVFNSLSKNKRGAVSGAAARETLLKSGLDASSLRRIWTLSDIDGDGALDASEWSVCQKLVEAASRGETIPDHLPLRLVPPTKR